MPKTKLNYHDRPVKVRSMTKTRQDNGMTDYTSVVYAEIIIELSWPIRQDVVYHKKVTGQQRDQSYRCDLHIIQYWIVKTDRIVCSLTKTRQDNDMIDHIGPLYVKNKIEMSCLIR